MVYYKTTVLINHKTNRRTHTECPCPLMRIQQISALSFQKLTIPPQETRPFYSGVILSLLCCSDHAVLLLQLKPAVIQMLFNFQTGEYTCSTSSFSLMDQRLKSKDFFIHHPLRLLKRNVSYPHCWSQEETSNNIPVSELISTTLTS